VIRVGQVAGAYGLEGAVKVIPLTDFADRFDPGASLLLEGAKHQVEWSRPSHPGLVVKLRGIDNRTMAELLRGRYLELPDEEMRSLEAGRFYHRQVVGLAALLPGQVKEVLAHGHRRRHAALGGEWVVLFPVQEPVGPMPDLLALSRGDAEH